MANADSMKCPHKYFPELDETQKWHMRQAKQGVPSTKLKEVIKESVPMVAPEATKKRYHGQNCRVERNYTLRSDREIPYSTKLRKQLHHDTV